MPETHCQTDRQAGTQGRHGQGDRDGQSRKETERDKEKGLTQRDKDPWTVQEPEIPELMGRMRQRQTDRQILRGRERER